MAAGDTSEADQLTARVARLEARRRRVERVVMARNRLFREALEESIQLTDEILPLRARLNLLPLVGVPGGVQLQYLTPPGHPEGHLTELRGTLLEVGPAHARVDFGPEGEWAFPNDHLGDRPPVGRWVTNKRPRGRRVR
jgi:hypothetical protein